MAHDVFISYAKEDRHTAHAVCKALEAEGILCWYAPRDVRSGAVFEDAIVDAISESRLMVLILSAHANSSRFVRRECACADEVEVTVLPFRIEDVRPNGALKLYLGSVQWLDALTPHLKSHLESLVKSVRINLQEAERQRALQSGATPAISVLRANNPPAPNSNNVSLWASSPKVIARENRFRASLWIGLSALTLLGMIIAFAAVSGLWSKKTTSNVQAGTEPTPETTTPTKTPVGTTKGVLAFDVTSLGAPIISPDDLYHVALSDDGQWLASTGGNKVRLWKVNAPDKSIELEDKSTDGSTKRWLAVAFSPDGQTLACGNDQGTLQIWRLSDYSPINQLSISGVRNIFRVSFSADGQTLLSASLYGRQTKKIQPKKIHLWRASDLSSLGDMTLESRSTIIAINPDQRVVAIKDPLNGLQLWSIEKQSFLKQLDGDVNKAHYGAFSADGGMLVLSNNDGTVQLINMADGHLIRKLAGPEGEILRVAISRNAQIIAGGWSDGTVQVWRVSDGTVIKSLTEHKQSVKSLAFSANNQILASAGADKQIHLWQISEKKE